MTATSHQNKRHRQGRKERLPEPARSRGDSLVQVLKAEANLLRLPLFALSTKGLRSLDGLECRGTTSRAGQPHAYVYRVTRNTATLYPGPLSRAAHQALLSLLTERGLPAANPVTWAWRDLCRRIGICYSGKTVAGLKAALAATRGLLIDSQHAVYAKPKGQLLSTSQRHLSLYTDLAFVNSQRPDGSVADGNYVWLADWYLDNLNALFTAPLDYDLWRWLDRRSPVASRLYEFFLLNFFSGAPVLRLNYPTLAQSLPVRPERYYADAQRQLTQPFRLVTLQDVVSEVNWTKTKAGVFQLHVQPGPRLAASATRSPQLLPFVQADFTAALEVKELRHLKPPAWGVVADFYRRWSEESNHRPTRKELTQAQALLDQHGQTKAKALIPRVVQLMKQKWPEAKTFGAVSKYLDEAAAVYDRDQRHKAQRRQKRLSEQRERREDEKRHQEKAKFRATWQPVWERLSEPERDAIRHTALGSNKMLRNHSDSAISLMLCLKELARRHQEESSSTAEPQP